MKKENTYARLRRLEEEREKLRTAALELDRALTDPKATEATRNAAYLTLWKAIGLSETDL